MSIVLATRDHLSCLRTVRIMPKRSRTEAEESASGSAKPSSTARICIGSYEHVLYGVDATLSYDSHGVLKVTFNPVYMFEAHTAQIKACAIGGRYLASGGVDEVLKLYDLKKRKDLGSLLSHDGSITAIKFPPADASPSHMLSSDENNRIIIWRVKDWTPQIQLTTRHGTVNDLSIHPSGKICLSVGTDRNVRLWNLVTGKKAAAHKLGREEPLKVQWNHDGSRYAILFDSRIGIYDMSATLQHQFDVPSRNRFHAMTWFTQPGSMQEFLLATLESGTIQIFDTTTTFDLVETLTGHQRRVKAIATHLVVPKGRNEPILTVLSGSTDGDVKMWSPASKSGKWAEIGSWNCGEGRITCLAVCDAAIEDLESVVKRRVPIKQEEDDDEDEVEIKQEEGEEEEAEEFSGFD